MSVHSSIRQNSPQALALPVFVITIDGAKRPAIQHSTIVINDLGYPDVVEGSIVYVDAQGDEIPDVVELSTMSQEYNLYWFANDEGDLIYWQNGQYYNPDRTEIGVVARGFKPVGSSNDNAPNTKRQSVYILVGDLYYSAIEVQLGDSFSYEVEGEIVKLLEGWKVTYVLPSPVYADFHSIVSASTEQSIPTDFPVSGVTIAYSVPLYRTKREGSVPSSVTIGTLTRTYGGHYSLNSEAAYGEIIPPIIAATGRGLAEVVYRQRLSPIVAKGSPKS